MSKELTEKIYILVSNYTVHNNVCNGKDILKIMHCVHNHIDCKNIAVTFNTEQLKLACGLAISYFSAILNRETFYNTIALVSICVYHATNVHINTV